MKKIPKYETYVDVFHAVELGTLKQVEMSDTGIKYLSDGVGHGSSAPVIAVDWEAAIIMTTDYTFDEMLGLGLIWGNSQYDPESDWGVVNQKGTLIYKCELEGLKV